MTERKEGPNRGNAGKGRPKGSLNKTTRSAKEALEAAFEGMGGVPQLLAWAQSDPGEFYKLWAKLLPKDLEVSGKNGGPIEVTVRFAREGRRITAG